MPRAKPFSKKTSTTYALVHRPQNDPLIHDTSAPSQLFTELGPTQHPKAAKYSDPASSAASSSSSGRNIYGNSRRAQERGDLEDEFGLAVRKNEGEAAEHGIFYDDSKYDYMQHMRELGGGDGAGAATWVEGKQKGKGKEKGQSLEDALRDADLDDAQSLGGRSEASYVTSSSVAWSARPSAMRSVYEQQQDVPDEIAGFRPDMDPRLREVMEALDDEEYVDDEDDIFDELAKDGEDMDREDWEDTLYDDDEGWESDGSNRTEKPDKERGTVAATEDTDVHPLTEPASDMLPNAEADTLPSEPSIPAPSAESQDLLANLAASKRGADNKPTLTQPVEQLPKQYDLASSAALSNASSLFGGKRKKRKGALTSGSGFSMSSSALARTEPLSILDSRFDRIAEEYMNDGFGNEDEEGMSVVSGMSGMSKASGMSRSSKASGMSAASRGSAWGGSQASQNSDAPSLVSEAQFGSVLDEYLGGAQGQAKARLMRKGGTQGRWQKGQGMKQLDDIRAGLGPARVGQKYAAQKA